MKKLVLLLSSVMLSAVGVNLIAAAAAEGAEEGAESPKIQRLRAKKAELEKKVNSGRELYNKQKQEFEARAAAGTSTGFEDLVLLTSMINNDIAVLQVEGTDQWISINKLHDSNKKRRQEISELTSRVAALEGARSAS